MTSLIIFCLSWYAAFAMAFLGYFRQKHVLDYIDNFLDRFIYVPSTFPELLMGKSMKVVDTSIIVDKDELYALTSHSNVLH